MIKKLFAVAVVCLCLTSISNAQALGSDYRTAIGAKFWPGAITVKHFTKNTVALEGLLYFWNYGFRFTGLYEYHGDINGAPGLKYYLGPGAHVGFYNDRWGRRYLDRDGRVDIGVDGVIGLDYKIKGAPINLSIDWQPSFSIISHPDFRSFGGLAVRFALN